MKAATSVAAIALLGLVGGFGLVSLATGDDDPPSIASQCPEQVRMIEAAGIPGDLESGPLGQCASIEQTREFVNAYQRNMESARQPDDPATKAPSSERWMTGLGDQARYLTPAEVARAEAAIAEQSKEG